MPSLDADRLTWAVLLGRWVDFAQSALALPQEGDGRRLRQAVPDIIMLQAVWFALMHLDELDPCERALGLDRAQILIDKHSAVLRGLWRGQALPPALADLVQDARQALARGQTAQEPPAMGR